VHVYDNCVILMIKMDTQPNIPISKVVIDTATRSEVDSVLSSGQIVWGPKVKALESKFAKLCGLKDSVAVTSGTSALHTALSILKIGYGDEVITTPFTYVATSNVICLVGATPVFVDIDPKTFNLNPELIEAAITPRTKAILDVDLYGLPADYFAINKIAQTHHLYLIEDAAQAVGASYHGHMTGTLGTVSCFSLYATKNLMCGEGGMVTSQSSRLTLKARSFRNHGEAHGLNYEYHGVGHNYCLSDIHATIALGQFKKLKSNTTRRQTIAKRYTQAFQSISGLIAPTIPPHLTHVFHQYTLRLTHDYPLTRDQFQQKLLDKGITTRVYYPQSLHRLSHLNPNHQKYHLPETNKAAREVISIPVHPYLTDAEVDYIIETVVKISRK
jgi:perosamine synthetase